ncbi:ABC transporter permease [Oceanomicrobium pacificus]|uniref:ABC transporter permease subunit n=1 Tax=Oceanomicrobium pacificus TaxID=2692916 RepID=A0A6B0TX17_9RHOB|nr:ABC transporter permease subunit [Oceanomicrobium pacificus]MXU66038.1 ABC transporter permease subunit [Oceanomicrobium pacificus]
MTRSHILFLNLTGIALFLCLWEIAGRAMGPSLLAAPTVVVPEYIRLLMAGDMLRELAGSLRQMLVGFGLACIIGMPLGALMGRIRTIDLLVHPWVSMIVVTSAAALAPIFILMFGTGFEFRVAIVFVSSFGYVTLTAYHGARGIDPKMLDVGNAFSTGPVETYSKIILPALFPYLITGARLGLIHAIRAMVMAEMFVLVGYGGLIFQTGQDLSTAPLISYLVTLMAVSVGANMALGWAGRQIAPWYDSKMAAG